MPKKCEKCGRPATYKFTRFVSGKPEDHYLCEDHAVDNSKYMQKTPGPEEIKQWLKGIVENAGAAAAPQPKSVPDIRCRACGLPFEAYKRTLLLGCPECYRSFEEQLAPELRKFHGEVRHFGRSPRSAATKPGLSAPPQARVETAPAPPAVAVAGEAPQSAAPTPTPQQPKREEPRQENLEALRKQLKQAVEHENFEEAARLRDQIRQAERQL
ncbi:MAG: UvrB/UvrC motif-containing protein [Candidatus Sumerlaeota bacterium]|nr:UvrB/UvrC motif-containing protein [Candidatus Sumerlaeota bacterium]